MDKESKILTVTVTSNNKYYIHNVEVPADNLGNVLSQEIKNYPDGLLIETDGNSNHGTVVKLMDKAREVGVNAISLDQI